MLHRHNVCCKKRTCHSFHTLLPLDGLADGISRRAHPRHAPNFRAPYKQGLKQTAPVKLCRPAFSLSLSLPLSCRSASCGLTRILTLLSQVSSSSRFSFAIPPVHGLNPAYCLPWPSCLPGCMCESLLFGGFHPAFVPSPLARSLALKCGVTVREKKGGGGGES